MNGTEKNRAFSMTHEPAKQSEEKWVFRLNGKLVGFVHNKEDAEFLARAVRSFDATRAALAALREDMRMLRDGEWILDHDPKGESVQASIDRADAALALARGDE